jgi:hypothetical protein
MQCCKSWWQARRIYTAAKEVAGMETGLKAFRDAIATVVGAKLASGDRRAIGRRYWNTNKDFLKSIAGDEVMAGHNLTDWAAAPLVQKEQRQTSHTAAKNKWLHTRESGSGEQASRVVVGCVGNMEVPMWRDGNNEPVEAHAIELRHKLDAQYLGQRVKYEVPDLISGAHSVRSPTPSYGPEFRKAGVP